MTKILLSSYEGNLIGYELNIDDKELKFNQEINCQESTKPIRSLVQHQQHLYITKETQVEKFNLVSRRMVNLIEVNDRVDSLLMLKEFLLVLHNDQIAVYDPQGELLQTYKPKHKVLQLIKYNDSTFLALCKRYLLGFCLNKTQQVSQLELKDDFFAAQLLSEDSLALLSERQLAKLDLKTGVTNQHWEGAGLNAFLFADSKFFAGQQNGHFVVLDQELKLIKKYNLETRIKKIFELEEQMYCVVSPGTVKVVGFAEELVEIGQKEFSVRLVDGIKWTDLEVEGIQEDAGIEEMEEMEEFEEWEENEELGEKE